MDDIQRSDMIKPLSLEKKKDESSEIRSPHMIDLRTKNIPSRMTGAKNMIDVMGAKEEVFFMPEQKKRRISGPLAGMAFFGIMIIFLLHLASAYSKGEKLFSKVSYSVSSAYQDLLHGGEKLSQGKEIFAKNYFEQAKSDFDKAMNEIWFFRNDPSVKSITAILDGGSSLSEAGKMMSEMTEEFRGFGDALIEQKEGFLKKIQDITKKIPALAQYLAKAVEAFGNVNPALIPAQYREKFSAGLIALKKADQKMMRLQKMLPGLMKLLGAEEPHEFMILLQNNDEVRPTGGFIGSYLKVQMGGGSVKNIALEDVYDIDDPFQGVIEPPEEIKKFGNRWFFRDSNYSADFRKSGEKALWLYENETGIPGPQTVMAVNHTLLGRLLEITGPIEIEGLLHPFTSENYRHVLTYIVESKLEGYEDPKKILKKFVPVLQKRLFQKGNAQAIQKVILEEMVQKNILGFSRDPEIQMFFEELGIDGKLKETGEQEDYLAVIASSFSGNKSDAFIQQTIRHETVFEQNGQIADQLTIERQHLWSERIFQDIRLYLAAFSFRDFPPHIVNILGGGENKQAMRVYVPEGSILQSIEGIEIEKVATRIDNDNGKTYFAFDFITGPGEKKSIVLRYTLPFTLDPNPISFYRFTAQKQPGARPSQFIKKIYPGSRAKLLKEFPAEKKEITLQKDFTLATLWGKPEDTPQSPALHTDEPSSQPQ